MVPCIAMRKELRPSALRSYMLHPFAIATTLARSSIAFSNLFLALALNTALDGRHLLLPGTGST